MTLQQAAGYHNRKDIPRQQATGNYQVKLMERVNGYFLSIPKGMSSYIEKQIFKATDVGCFVKTNPWSGEVVSVYSRVINILHPEGHLVSIVMKESQMTVFGIKAASFFHGNEKDSIKELDDIRPGTPVRFDGKRLVVKDTRCDISDARLWKGELSFADIMDFDLRKAALLRKSLLAEGKKGGFWGLIHPEDGDNMFVRKAREVLDGVSVGSDSLPLVRGLSRFLGLGVGFTPSGDDFISGALLGERILSLFYTRTKKRFFHIEKEEITKNLEKTSYAGKTLLLPALHGHFPSYLLDLSRGLAQASHLDEMINVVRGAVSHGETSGTDAAVGLSWYLDFNSNLAA
jgi:hypothetical protein